MDSESYENPAIADMINEHYIAIKVDRDERPDVDARYQAAVSAISGQGGWPLTGFLTPEGRLFYGGTYFPPTTRHGRQGFSEILKSLAAAYKDDRAKVMESAENVTAFLQKALDRQDQSSEISPQLLDGALNDLSREFDIRYGGFGTAPKFPHATALDFLLESHDRTGAQWMLNVVTTSLTAMARGGMRDHLGGGFHRYSTDRTWTVPHFEKMLYDNAPLLKTYVHAYQLTGDALYKEVAFEIIRFVFEVLTDPKTGCFRSSQDADVRAGDDGSYFTWTSEEAKRLLSPDEFAVVMRRYDLQLRGEMQHDPNQNVLFIAKEMPEIASELGISEDAALTFFESGRAKLKEARRARQSPAVDPSVYASTNGMMITALLEAWKAFEIEELRSSALSSLEGTLRDHRLRSGLISHRPSRIGPEAFLEDQTSILEALLTAFECTADERFLREAEAIAEVMVTHFWDAETAVTSQSRVSAFNDVPTTHSRLGTLALKSKPIQDNPFASPNGVAVLCLLQLHSLTAVDSYRDRAERILRYFAGGIAGSGLFAATYFTGLGRLLFPPIHVVTTGSPQDSQTDALHQAALRTFRPGKSVLRIGPSGRVSVPQAARAFVSSATRPSALVCGRDSCSAPITDGEELVRVILSFDRRKAP